MKNFTKLTAVFLFIFSTSSYAVQNYVQATAPAGIVILNVNTGAINFCQPSFGAGAESVVCNKIGSTPTTSLSGNAQVAIISGSVNSDAVITNLSTGIMTICNLIYGATGSCVNYQIP